jgi:uncharacterized protein YrrD
MLRSGDDLRGLTIRATDDEIGKVDQFLFDDASWTIRYMVVNTGGWLLKELVLISPRSIETVAWEEGRVDVSLTRQQVEGAPDISTNQPVSRQMEEQLASHYNYQPYWYGPGLWGAAGVPFGVGAGYTAAAMAAAGSQDEAKPLQERAPQEAPRGDPHLRSTREVKGYRIHASDGEIGHVEDFVMDDESWSIRYLVVDTGGWLPGKQVLIAPHWASAVSWDEQAVSVDLTRDQVKDAPEFDPRRLGRDDEQLLHTHYRRKGYWEDVTF